MPPTSDGWPSRCSGVRLPKSLGGACDFGCGAQELGVDRAGADGIDSDAVRSQRVGEGLGHQHHAALAGGEAQVNPAPAMPPMLAISTMLPGLPWAFIASAAACALNNTPFRFTATSRSKSASVTSALSWCAVIPAFATMTSIPPTPPRRQRAHRDPRAW